jgi:DNA repair protein RecN (Recombination protein N)
MLERIYIQNLLFIKCIDLDLKNGFSVLTGETGAGKSILFECIKFALGSKLPVNFINNQDSASIILLEFDITNNVNIQKKLQDDMIEYENNKLILKKIFLNEKKSKIFVNDTPVSNNFIKQIASDLVEYQGQHSQAMLLNQAQHIHILDNYANITDKLSQLDILYHETISLKKELELIEDRIDNQEKEKDYLTHVFKELQELSPEKGEAEKLAEQRSNMLKFQKTTNYISDAINYLDQAKVFTNLNNAYKALVKCETNIINLDDEICNLDQLTISLNDLKDNLEKKLSNIDLGHDQDKIDDRLFLLREIARKYRTQPDELNDLLEKTSIELEQIKNLEENAATIRKSLLAKKEEYLFIAKNISMQRKNAALQLETSVEKELFDLKMEKTIFKVKIITDENKISPKGIDHIEFMASNNPGLPLAPLKDISSGGEISRFMLAIRVVITKLKSPPVIIFDEIDTGLGGAVADAVGQKIKILSENYQILVVTHHPQVASKSDQHYLVAKTFDNDETNMSIAHITKNLQINELARMISGSEITQQSKLAAEQLLKPII